MPKLVLTPSFKRALKKKPLAMRTAIMECVARLAGDPTSQGLQVHRVRGTKGVWEAYVDKGNRVTFERPGAGEIVMLAHCNHDMLRQY